MTTIKWIWVSIRRIPYVGIRYVLVHGRVVSKGVKGVKRYPLTLFGSFWIFLDLSDLSNLLGPFSLSMYDSLSVLTPTTCYKLVSRLSANIYSLTILLDRMAYDTRPHVWSYQAWNQRENLYRKKNPLSSWALDKSVRWFITTVKRNIMRVRRCVVCVMLWYIWILSAYLILLCPCVKHFYLLCVCNNSMIS